MKTLDLIVLHFRLECVGINPAGYLIPISCPNPDGRMTAFVLAEASRLCNVWRFRALIP